MAENVRMLKVLFEQGVCSNNDVTCPTHAFPLSKIRYTVHPCQRSESEPVAHREPDQNTGFG